MNRLRIPVIIGLTIVWAMLWGEITILSVLGGLTVATLVIVIFPFPSVDLHGRFRPLSAIVVLARFLFDLVVASFQVAWIAVRPAPPPRSAVIEVHLVGHSDLLQVMTGELVSLVPGSLLIELDAETGRMWLHVLDGSTPEAIASARHKARLQEHRVLAAFGSREDYEASREQLKAEEATA